MMNELNRRLFLQETTAVSLAATAWAMTGQVPAAATDSRLRVGLIGCGGRGMSLAESFAGIAEIVAVCDPDASRRESARQKTGAQQAVSDLRRILDDPAVDAVVVATPDHWHAPAAILACEAGKHVYVEKPQSHNLRESRLLLDAARRNRVVVQHGTQSRTQPLIANAIQLLREGSIGDILLAKAWNIQRRKDIGREQPSEVPAGLDYDTWVGPAEFVPFQKNRFHYDWHWWHNFGTGDIGNDGTHEIDIARWGLGVTHLPTLVTAVGGKYYFDDDQQFPDTATCVFEWPGETPTARRRQLVFEMRLWSNNYPYNCDSGVEFLGTQGRLFVSKRGKLEVFDDRNQRVELTQPREPAQLAVSHQADFVDAIRSGRTPNADVAEGHASVALVHLANIAVRVGRSLQVDPDTERIVSDDQANQLLGRPYREGGHWAIPRSS